MNTKWKKRNIPLRRHPIFLLVLSTDSSVWIPHLTWRVCNQCRFPSCQPWEGAELLVSHQHPDATAEGQPRQSCYQYLPTLGQGCAEIWCPRSLWLGGGGCHLDTPWPASVFLSSTPWDPVLMWQRLFESHRSSPDPGQRRRLSVAPNHLSQQLC